MHVPLISPAPAPQFARIEFHGRRGEFGRLVTRGALLELVTLGFYRFWLATDMRRHLWSNTAVDGDSAEYTGTARELLIGFLVALAILVPIYLAYFLAGLEAERLQAFASIPLVLFFYLFAQFAIYRARRYRMSRTVWRGVRLWMTGSGWDYAWRAVLWTALVILTLGLALPWRAAALERFKMRNSSYGHLQGRFDGAGSEFFKRGWWLWLLMVLTGWLLVPLPFIYGAYKSIEWRWWISGIRFGEVRFESDLRRGALIGTYWAVIGWSTLVSVGLGMWASLVVGLAAIGADGGTTPTDEQIGLVMQNPVVLVALGLGYIVAALVGGIIVRIHLTRDVWARVAASTTVHNMIGAEDVAAHGELTSALGEGLADSLDVGGF